MSIDDYIILLIDSLDDLAGTTNAAQQQRLRHEIGSTIATLHEQLDALDYAYALFVCKLDDATADYYRQMYLNAAREYVESQA